MNLARFSTLVVIVFVLVACSRQETEQATGHGEAHGTPEGWRFALEPGDPSEGRKLFAELECYKCHEIRGERFPDVAPGERGIGPELSQMAGLHTLEFFAEAIVNPNAVIDPDAKERGYLGDDGKSKMPDYSDVLTVRQVADLSSYLASLKAPSGEKALSGEHRH